MSSVEEGHISGRHPIRRVDEAVTGGVAGAMPN